MLKRFVRLACLFLLSTAAVTAADEPIEFTPEFRTLSLGLTATELPTEGYEAFACGSNGGPPLEKLSGWVDYMRCQPDAMGLHEVYVEFGRRAGQLSDLFRDQYEEELWIQKFSGTRMANHPVVLSLLFDDEGVVRGFRAVTDDRAPTEDRGRAYLLRFAIFPMYGESEFACVDRPPAPGETGVGDTYLNQVCTRDFEGKHIRIEAHFFRKPGQTGMDEHGMYMAGQYESLTRWEVYDARLPNLP
ncbi:MAG: hypothetical protein JWR75_232 [Devosia sp.]|nr:hypothetical protein [Devosia sp.]